MTAIDTPRSAKDCWTCCMAPSRPSWPRGFRAQGSTRTELQDPSELPRDRRRRSHAQASDRRPSTRRRRRRSALGRRLQGGFGQRQALAGDAVARARRRGAKPRRRLGLVAEQRQRSDPEGCRGALRTRVRTQPREWRSRSRPERPPARVRSLLAMALRPAPARAHRQLVDRQLGALEDRQLGFVGVPLRSPTSTHRSWHQGSTIARSWGSLRF